MAGASKQPSNADSQDAFICDRRGPPLYFVFMSAFISALLPCEDVFHFLSPLSPWTSLPNRLTFSNVIAVWESPFSQAMLASTFVTAAMIALGARSARWPPWRWR